MDSSKVMTCPTLRGASAMNSPVQVAYADGEKDLAEEVGQPIQQAGYSVDFLTDPGLLLQSAAGIVVCGTSKTLGNGHASRMLDALSRLKVPVFFAQMEKDLSLQAYPNEGIFHFWLDPVEAARQLVSTLKRNIAAAHRDRIFISYSRKDFRWLERLQVHLRPLERLGQIARWDDTSIDPGEKWKSRIREAVATARVAVLLVSADYLASDFITSDELLPLLVKAETEGAVIIPVIISPCRFTRTATLSQFQPINPPSRPLIKMNPGQREDLFVRITEAIEKALRKGTGRDDIN
jgi:hypothetical protein